MQPSPETINQIKQVLPAAPDPTGLLLQFQPVTGGSINYSYRVIAPGGQSWFLKLNEGSRLPGIFEQELHGLAALRETGAIRVPEAIYTGADQEQQFLLLEWIKSGNRSITFWQRLGEQLAALHRHSNPAFGWDTDNYNGALLQRNRFHEDWISFFHEQRISPQLELATRYGLLDPALRSQFDKLFMKLLYLFEPEPPALLHGDLWSGNLMCNELAEPVLVDPAVYYGHRCMDLGMTTLFGGFDRSFYDAYNSNYPLPTGAAEQWELCNLYPLLIHLNLFGLQYLPRIAAILNRYI